MRKDEQWHGKCHRRGQGHLRNLSQHTYPTFYVLSWTAWFRTRHSRLFQCPYAPHWPPSASPRTGESTPIGHTKAVGTCERTGLKVHRRIFGRHGGRRRLLRFLLATIPTCCSLSRLTARMFPALCMFCSSPTPHELFSGTTYAIYARQSEFPMLIRPFSCHHPASSKEQARVAHRNRWG